MLVHPFYKPPRDTCCSGMALIFTLAPGVEVLHDVSHSRSVPLFREQVVFVWVENILVSLKADRSRCCGDAGFCYVVWLCFWPQ